MEKSVQDFLNQQDVLRKRQLGVFLQLEKNANKIFHGVLDGWSSGDDIVDFALLLNDGFYNERLVVKIKELRENIKNHIGDYLLAVVENDEFESEDSLLVQSNVIVFGIISDEHLYLDNDELKMKICMTGMVVYTSTYDQVNGVEQGYSVIGDDEIEVDLTGQSIYNFLEKDTESHIRSTFFVLGAQQIQQWFRANENQWIYKLLRQNSLNISG